METPEIFDEIRPYNSSEINAALRRITSDGQFMSAVSHFFPDVEREALRAKINTFRTAEEFQSQIILPAATELLRHVSAGVSLTGTEAAARCENRLYISNHRDIVLDPLLFAVELFRAGFHTPEIAIGNNLFVTPWMEPLVRVNKNIVVKRNIPIRQQLAVSATLSAYMRHAVSEKRVSVWLAQREGRAKDANDRTQESLLKMLNISGKKSILENFAEINITPLAITYEYDPCDFLKAKEFQLKRDNPDYRKTPQDDAESMLTGINGWKGEIRFAIGPIDDEIKNLPQGTKNEQIAALAALIDEKIFENYKIFAHNKVAYDLLTGGNRFANDYSEQEKRNFENYLRQQLAKIDIPQKDDAFLRRKMLEMYANPLKNKLKL